MQNTDIKEKKENEKGEKMKVKGYIIIIDDPEDDSKPTKEQKNKLKKWWQKAIVGRGIKKGEYGNPKRN